MALQDLKDAALAYARAQGNTAAQVRSASNAQLAVACGYTYDSIPKPFWAYKVRHYVVRVLQQEEDAAKDETVRLRVRAKIRELAEFIGADIALERLEDGTHILTLTVEP